MSLDASAAVVNIEVYTTERSRKMKISQNKYLSLIAVFGLIACGNPTMEMPDRESSDASADSQQFPDSQMVSEDADSSIIEEDSSVMESDASVSDSSDSGSDSSRADAAARETNVLYRTADGGYEGIISLSRDTDSISYDGGPNSDFIVKIGARYKTSVRQGGVNDILGRVFVSGCSVDSWMYLRPSNVVSVFPETSGEVTQSITIQISGSCAGISLTATIVRMETMTGSFAVLDINDFIVNRGDGGSNILFLNKTVRVE